MVRLTHKGALRSAAARLPKQPTDVQAGMQLPGYIASLTADAVFVRFLNQTTGRAGLAHLPLGPARDPRARFFVGQTVLARVTGTDSVRALCTLSLKESPVEVSTLANLFAYVLAVCLRIVSFICVSLYCVYPPSDQLLAEKIITAAEGRAPVPWSEQFPLGTVVHGRVNEIKPYGAVCDMDANADVAGLVANEQVEYSTGLAIGVFMT